MLSFSKRNIRMKSESSSSADLNWKPRPGFANSQESWLFLQFVYTMRIESFIVSRSHSVLKCFSSSIIWDSNPLDPILHTTWLVSLLFNQHMGKSLENSHIHWWESNFDNVAGTSGLNHLWLCELCVWPFTRKQSKSMEWWIFLRMILLQGWSYLIWSTKMHPGKWCRLHSVTEPTDWFTDRVAQFFAAAKRTITSNMLNLFSWSLSLVASARSK